MSNVFSAKYWMHSSDFKPQFVMVMGGSGSGKSHFVANHPVFSHYALMDVDAIKGDRGAAAIGDLKAMMLAAMQKKQNIAHTTMGANLAGQKNKIALAHSHGYFVTLIFIDTPPEKAVAQMKNRVNLGGHHVSPEEVIASNKKSRDNFETLSKLADKTDIVNQSITESNQIVFKIGEPSKFTRQELLEAAKLILGGAQVLVSSSHLFQQLGRAKKIALAFFGGKVIAVSAIKMPGASYRDDVFYSANVEDEAQKYKYEMGWKIVAAQHRGKGIGETLSAKLLQTIHQPMYATVRSKNIAALTPVMRLGFKPLGEPFTGASGNEITLLVK